MYIPHVEQSDRFSAIWGVIDMVLQLVHVWLQPIPNTLDCFTLDYAIPYPIKRILVST